MSKRKPQPKIIEATKDSQCFADLYWEDGVAVAEFARNGAVYEYPMSRKEFKEWIKDGSLGGWFNENLR